MTGIEKSKGLILLLGIALVLSGCQKTPANGAAHQPGPNNQPGSPQRASTKRDTPRTVPLDELIIFTDGKDCLTAPVTSALLDNLLTITADYRIELGKVVAPKRFSTVLGTPKMDVSDTGLHEVTLPLKGLWHGLKLVNVAKSATPESDYGFTSYRFDEPFEKVRTVLNGMGFGFDGTGEQPPRGIEDYAAASLFRIRGLTALDCQ